jgi:DNA modification methylase
MRGDVTRWTLHHGDALDVLRTLPDASVDAVVTDPPAGIAFMGKDWDGAKGGRAAWVAWLSAILAECYRIAKPGARLVCWSIPRTSHWTGCAVEDAGWLIENTIAHMFGSGFPKGRSQIKPAREDWWIARKPGGKVPALRIDECRVASAIPVTEDPNWRRAGRAEVRGVGFHGGGSRTEQPENMTTAGRWPANVVFSHLPDCRRDGERKIEGTAPRGKPSDGEARINTTAFGRDGGTRRNTDYADPDGLETVADYRCVEGCPVRLLDEQSGERPSPRANGNPNNGRRDGMGYGGVTRPAEMESMDYRDTGTASRFFQQFEHEPFVYQAKASRRDRNAGCEGLPERDARSVKNQNCRGCVDCGRHLPNSAALCPCGGPLATVEVANPPRANVHPTVKSTALMRYLVRLVAAPGSLVLDPFAGSGSTGRGALLEGCRFIGIERDEQYVEIARARLTEADRPPVQPALALGA